jgi:putative transposase
VLDRDENAAINILNKGLSTVGHTGRSALGGSPDQQLDVGNASGENTSIDVGESLCQ